MGASAFAWPRLVKGATGPTIAGDGITLAAATRGHLLPGGTGDGVGGGTDHTRGWSARTVWRSAMRPTLLVKIGVEFVVGVTGHVGGGDNPAEVGVGGGIEGVEGGAFSVCAERVVSTASLRDYHGSREKANIDKVAIDDNYGHNCSHLWFQSRPRNGVSRGKRGEV